MSSARSLRLEVILSAVNKITAPLKQASASHRELAGAVKQSQDALRKLKNTQDNVSTFRELNRAAAITDHQLRSTQQRLKEVGDALRATTAPSKDLVREYERLKSSASELSQRKAKLQNSLAETRHKLREAGIDTARLRDGQKRLAQSIAIANQHLNEHQKRLADANEKQRRLNVATIQYNKTLERRNQLMQTGTGALAGAAVVGAPVGLMVREYAAAEDAAMSLRAAMMGVNGTVGPEFQLIADLATKLGHRLPGTTADFQDMMTMLRRQGISAQAILSGLGEVTAYLGVQLKMPYSEAAEFAAKLQDATKTTERDMMGLMDVIQRSFYLGVDSNNLLSAFAKLSPALSTLRIKGLDAAKALSPLLVMADQAGMKGEAAGNAFRKVFQYALDVKRLGKANDELKSAGINLNFSDGNGEFGGMDKLFAELSKLKKLNTMQRNAALKELFGDDAETLQAVSLIIDKGKAGYAEVQTKMAAQAALQQRVNAQLGTLINLWEAASGTFTNTMVVFGETLAPEIKSLTEWFGRASEAVGQWAKAHPMLAGGLIKIAALLAVLLTIVGGFSLAIAAVLGPMALLKLSVATLGIKLPGLGSALLFVGKGLWWVAKTAITALITGLRALGIAAMTNPLILIIAAIVAAIAGLAYLVWKYWDQIKAAFSAAFDAVAKVASNFFTEVRSAFSGGLLGISRLILDWSPVGLFYSAFANVLSWFGIELPGKFSEFGAQMMQGLIQGVLNTIGAVKDAIVGAADSVVGWFKEKLGIHSPSRVFASFGGYTMQGFDEGLSATQHEPLRTVADFAKQLTSAGAGLSLSAGIAFADTAQLDTRAPLKSVFASAPTTSSSAPTNNTHGGDTYIINVYPTAGSNNDELAQLIRREIEKVQREKDARLRSALSDRD